jgi:hypothetical protein
MAGSTGRLDRAWQEGGTYPCNDDRTTYLDLRAAFIVASWHTEGADPLPKEQTSPSANDDARSRGAAGQIDSLGIGLELGRPGAPNALRVSSACFQDLGCTRNQPVVALPCFDGWRLSSFTSRARRSQDLLTEEWPAISHRWRSDRTAARGDPGSVEALELSFDSRFSRSPAF